MLLTDFFNYLTYGELSQLEIGGNPAGQIDPTNYDQVIPNINAGLIELYKRFPLSVKKLTVNYVTDQEDYTLAASDILIIEKVLNEANEPYPLNDAHDDLGIFQLNFNTISIPYDINTTDFAKEDTTFVVQYKASPTLLDPTLVDATGVTLPITDQYLEPLLNYVTYRIFSGINANDPDAVNYYNKFEAACALLRNAGLFHKDAPKNIRLENNGWL